MIAGEGVGPQPDVAQVIGTVDAVDVRPHRQHPVRAGGRGAVQRPRRQRVAAVGAEQQPGPQRPRPARAAAAYGDAGPRPLDRLRLPAVPDGRAGLPGGVDDPPVELQPGDDPAIAGNPVHRGHAEHHRRVVADVQRQPAHRRRGGEPGKAVQAELGQLGQRHRPDEVPAHLVAGEAGPVDQHHVESAPGQPRGRGRAGRAAAEHGHIAVPLVSCHRRPASLAAPAPARAPAGRSCERDEDPTPRPPPGRC